MFILFYFLITLCTSIIHFIKSSRLFIAKKPNIAKAIDRDVDASLSGVEIKRIEIAMLIARNTKLSINSIIQKNTSYII